MLPWVLIKGCLRRNRGTRAEMRWQLSFVLCEGEVKMDDSALFHGGTVELRESCLETSF